jgi:hypothetical protein
MHTIQEVHYADVSIHHYENKITIIIKYIAND